MLPPPTEAAAVPKKAFPMVALIVGVALLVGLGGGAAWFLLRPKPKPPQPTAQATVPAPSVSAQSQQAQATPPPSAASRLAEASTPSGGPNKRRAAKPGPAPAPPPQAPAPDPRAVEIANLQNLAREAYARGAYAEPSDSSAITYAKRVLALSPDDNYAKTILENSVNGGKYQAQQALQAKNFAVAHRIANALAQLLPGRNDIVELQRDIELTEKAEEAARRPPPAAQVPVLSFRAYHMHSEKAPADRGPYCLGTLSVLGGRIKFVGQSASDGQVHNLEFACSEAREIKRNARVAAKQGGFHIRTPSANTNFVPEDALANHATAVANACTK